MSSNSLPPNDHTKAWPFGLSPLEKLKMLHDVAQGYAYGAADKRNENATDLWKACEDVQEWLSALVSAAESVPEIKPGLLRTLETPPPHDDLVFDAAPSQPAVEAGPKQPWDSGKVCAQCGLTTVRMLSEDWEACAACAHPIEKATPPRPRPRLPKPGEIDAHFAAEHLKALEAPTSEREIQAQVWEEAAKGLESLRCSNSGAIKILKQLARSMLEKAVALRVRP